MKYKGFGSRIRIQLKQSFQIQLRIQNTDPNKALIQYMANDPFLIWIKGPVSKFGNQYPCLIWEKKNQYITIYLNSFQKQTNIQAPHYIDRFGSTLSLAYVLKIPFAFSTKTLIFIYPFSQNALIKRKQKKTWIWFVQPLMEPSLKR